MNLSDKKQQYEIEVKAPIGLIKAIVDIELEDDHSFQGETQIMGRTCQFTDGEISDGNTFSFSLTVPLPFGKLEMDIVVRVDEEGNVTGEVKAPRRKLMIVNGHRIA